MLAVTAPARILLVDDEIYITDIVSRWLTADGYSCVRAHSAEEALERLAEDDFDLVVSDIGMGEMSGLEMLAEIRRDFPDTAVLLQTAIDDRDTAISALDQGAFGYLIKPLAEQEVMIAVASALERRRLQTLERDYRNTLERTVRDRTEEIRRAREETSLLLVTISEFRDVDTGAHVRRMGLYAEALGRALGWDEHTVEQLRLAAPMHDVGKIAIPDRILLKPGRLSDEEFAEIKKHADIGAQILSGADVPLLHMAREIALGHHERWDGGGYPAGLSGTDIPAAARLVAIVDVYDALTNDRVYRKALQEQEALELMRSGRGSHFDPMIFDKFVDILPGIRRIRQRTESFSKGGTLER